MPSLTVVVEGVEQKIPLEAAAVTLGRGLESDVRLKDIKASRRHCQVVKTGKGFQCVDLSSGNGTYVNGVQIKSQILNHGDRITIGSTTIVFEDAPKPAVPSKVPTVKIPVASAPAPAPARSASGKVAAAKVATARVPVVPTRRTTERLEAVKPAAKSGPVPAAKSGRTGKTGARSSGVRPPRPAAEAPAKKSPALVLVMVIGVVVLGLAAGGYFLFGRDNGDQIKDQVEQLMKKGEAAEAQGRDDAAVAEYQKALQLCQGERYKIPASKLSKLIAQIEKRKGGGTLAPPKPDPKETSDKADAIPAKKAEIAEKYKLAVAGSADWAGALKEWTEFAGRKPPADGAVKAYEEIKAIQSRAREELASLRRKADALAKENKMAEAVDLLKQQAARFEGTEAQADLEAAIKQYDK
jgi:pSer/pThr/pTyr-binding forkhead associated (FHA) protein